MPPNMTQGEKMFRYIRRLMGFRDFDNVPEVDREIRWEIENEKWPNVDRIKKRLRLDEHIR